MRRRGEGGSSGGGRVEGGDQDPRGGVKGGPSGSSFPEKKNT